MPLFKFFILAIFFTPVHLEEVRDSVLMDTKIGRIEGEVFLNSKQQRINVFRGVPYAKPPLRELRFQKPQPLEPWTGVKKTRDKWPTGCPQTPLFGDHPIDHLEMDDCLYLNVFSPPVKSEKFPDGYSVMVWIHGGAFLSGSPREYGIHGIIDLLVAKDVVVVTVAYRLGPLGFFASEDGSLPGNWGLWDQTAALQWVRDNIASFGGNSNHVTLFGESAGGAFIGHLSISPHSQELFEQQILMSGNHLSPWAMSEAVGRISHWLAEQLQCDVPAAGQMADCLRTKSVQELRDGLTGLTEEVAWDLGIFDGSVLGFAPREDGDFFPEPFLELTAKAPQKPTIIGTNTMEMGVFVTPTIPTIHTKWKVDEKFDFRKFREEVRTLIPDKLSADSDALRRAVLDFYVYDKGDKHNQSFLIEKYEELLSDVFFEVPTSLFIEEHYLKWPIWCYIFDYYNEDEFHDEHTFKGAHHGMELRHLFNVTFLRQFPDNEEDILMTELVTSLWTNFAKFGDPTPDPIDGISWTKLGSKNENCLRIKPQMELKDSFDTESFRLWKKIFPDFLKLRQIPVSPAVDHDEL